MQMTQLAASERNNFLQHRVHCALVQINKKKSQATCATIQNCAFHAVSRLGSVNMFHHVALNPL